MRTALVLGGTLALLAATRPVAAQAPSGPGEEMVVSISEAVVYSGPGEKCFRTIKLRQGERVLVLRKSPADPGWLEIRPPFGSFSYINANFVSKNPKDPRVGMVCAPVGSLADIMPGSTFETIEPNVVVAKVERGTQLIFLPDGPVYAPSGTGAWMRIAPTPQEFRYIQASAVSPATAVQRASANSGQPAGGMPVASPVTGLGAAQADPTMDAYQRLQQIIANKADMSPDERRQALDQLQKMYALLKTPRSVQGGVAATQIPGNPNAVAATAPGGVPGQLVTRGNQQLPIAQNTAMYNIGSGGAPSTTATGVRWSSWGLLRKTSFQKDGQAMYVLLDNQGKPLLYAAPETGKTLDPYVNQTVALYGAVAYRSDEFIRMDFMTVSYVAPTQAKAGR